MSKSVAIVTGASSGIGKATALRLARDFGAIVLEEPNPELSRTSKGFSEFSRRFGPSPGPADGPHRPAASASAEKLIGAVGLEPRHACSRRHLEPGIAGAIKGVRILAASSEREESERDTASYCVSNLGPLTNGLSRR